MEERPRSGRPPILGSTFRRRLAQLKRLHPRGSAGFLAARYRDRYGTNVSEDTVRRALHDLRYAWRLGRRRQLTSAQKRARVVFARGHLGDSWYRRASADECTFNLYRHGNRCWVRANTGVGEDEPAPPRWTERQEAVSVSIIAIIGRGRKLAISFLPRNWTAEDLVQVFDDSVLPQLRRAARGVDTYELMLDNDGRHRTAVWRQFVARRRLRVLGGWPGNSPDLNPIENLFAWLKSAVERAQPTDETSLRRAIENAWEEFPVEFTTHMMDSMSARLRLCLKKAGGRTNY